MEISFIDHIVIIVKNIPETEKFYTTFLGAPLYLDEQVVAYNVGDTKVFFSLAKGGFEKIEKDNGGLNHLAFGVRNLDELQSFENRLNTAGIQNSGVKVDQYGQKDYVWFDDPSGTRLEIYCRPLE